MSVTFNLKLDMHLSNLDIVNEPELTSRLMLRLGTADYPITGYINGHTEPFEEAGLKRGLTVDGLVDCITTHMKSHFGELVTTIPTLQQDIKRWLNKNYIFRVDQRVEESTPTYAYLKVDEASGNVYALVKLCKGARELTFAYDTESHTGFFAYDETDCTASPPIFFEAANGILCYITRGKQVDVVHKRLLTAMKNANVEGLVKCQFS